MKHSNITMQKVWDLNILDVADKLQISYSPRGAYRKCHCFMHEDKNPSMWFKLSNNTWSCPVCQRGGGIVSLVEEHEGLKFHEAVDWLIREFSIWCYDDSTPYRPLKTSSRKAPAGNHLQKLNTVPAGSRYLSNPGRSLGPSDAPSNPALAGSQYLDPSLLTRCLSTQSPLCRALVSTGILTHDQMLSAAHRYHLGTTRDGGVIFWQTDRNQQVHDGKIMFYKSDCHRDHSHNPSSVSSRLIRQGRLPKDWKSAHCLFGLHLIAEGCKAAVVESEKTAVICSELLPEFTWLATGGKSNLTTEKLSPIKDCKIVIFPDTDPDGSTYRSWAEITAAASKALNTPIYISDILEAHATADQKSRKIDIADYIIESKTNPQI